MLVFGAAGVVVTITGAEAVVDALLWMGEAGAELPESVLTTPVVVPAASLVSDVEEGLAGDDAALLGLEETFGAGVDVDAEVEAAAEVVLDIGGAATGDPAFVPALRPVSGLLAPFAEETTATTMAVAARPAARATASSCGLGRALRACGCRTVTAGAITVAVTISAGCSAGGFRAGSGSPGSATGTGAVSSSSISSSAVSSSAVGLTSTKMGAAGGSGTGREVVGQGDSPRSKSPSRSSASDTALTFCQYLRSRCRASPPARGRDRVPRSTALSLPSPGVP